MASEIGSSGVKKLSALIVHHDRTVRRTRTALLNRYGFETQAVENALQVIDLHRYREKFDVIFMDVMIPFADNIEATKMLREMEVECMIIAVTAEDLDFSDAELYEIGLDKYCHKPLTAEFVASVKEELMYK